MNEHNFKKINGKLKKKNIKIKCPYCGAVNEYTPFEYTSEVIYCKTCNHSLKWAEIFQNLSSEDRKKVKKNRFLRVFVKHLE